MHGIFALCQCRLQPAKYWHLKGKAPINLCDEILFKSTAVFSKLSQLTLSSNCMPMS